MKVLAVVTSSNSTFFDQQISRLRQKGIEYTVVSATDNVVATGEIDQYEEGSWYKPKFGHTVPYYIYSSSKFYPKILREVVSNDFDLIHAQSGLTAPFVLAQPNRPIIMELRGSDLMGDYLNGHYPNFLKRTSSFYDEIIVRNQDMKDEISDRAHIIPSGVDLCKFSPMDQSLAQNEVGWNQSEKHMLFPYAANRRQRKNFELASNVYELVDDNLDMEINLHTLGDVPHEKVSTYLNATDLMILTSKLEGSPNTVKEAMACNTPVVSTDVGDVKERLNNVYNSFVGNDCRELVNYCVRVLGSEDRSNGRDHINEVSLENTTNKIVNVYESALNK